MKNSESLERIFDPNFLSPLVKDFTNILFIQADLESMEPNLRQMFSEKVGFDVQEKLGKIVLTSLSDNELDELFSFTENHPNASIEQLAEWLKKHIPDFEKQIKDVLSDYAKQFLEFVRQQHINMEAEMFKIRHGL